MICVCSFYFFCGLFICHFVSFFNFYVIVFVSLNSVIASFYSIVPSSCLIFATFCCFLSVVDFSFRCRLIASVHSTRSFLISTQLSSDSAEGGRRVAARADSDWLALWPLPCRWTDRVSVCGVCSRRPVVLDFLLLSSAPSRRASLSSDVSLQLYKRVIQSALMGVHIRPEPGLGHCSHLT